MKTLAFVLAALLGLAPSAWAQNSFRIDTAAQSTHSSMVRLAPSYVNARVLAANVSETFTVPTGSRWVLFSATCDFYAKTGATAAVPGADVTDGSASELNPSGWILSNVTQVSVITAATSCILTGAFYR